MVVSLAKRQHQCMKMNETQIFSLVEFLDFVGLFSMNLNYLFHKFFRRAGTISYNYVSKLISSNLVLFSCRLIDFCFKISVERRL